MLNIGVYQALNMLCTKYMNMYEYVGTLMENISYCPAYLYTLQLYYSW